MLVGPGKDFCVDGGGVGTFSGFWLDLGKISMDPYMLEDLKEFGLMWDGFPWIRGFSQISVDFEIFC